MNRVRIIGGQWKRRLVQFESLDGLRPTPDRVRETLFNWLMWELPNARVLDLCAGSGALGIEALSRGAAYCSFIEPQRAQALSLQRALQTLGAETTRFEVLNLPAERVQHLAQTQYDVIFLDPPYALDLWSSLSMKFQPFFAEKAWIYVEADRDLSTLGLPDHWSLHKQTRAGSVHAGLFQVLTLSD